MPEREMPLPNARSFADILQEIAANIGEIIRSEFRLAKIELRNSALKTITSAGALATGAAFAFYALGFLLLAIMFALRLALPEWLAALIVFLISSIVGAALIGAGVQELKKVNVVPERTAASVKEDVRWVKQQIS
jgi:uncharacterized membrane protein YqjE